MGLMVVLLLVAKAGPVASDGGTTATGGTTAFFFRPGRAFSTTGSPSDTTAGFRLFQ